MQVKKIFTYTIDELPMEVQNKVIANRIQELATNTTDVVLPELYEFLNHQYILLKEIIWNRSSGIRAFNCVIYAGWFPVNSWNKDEFDKALEDNCVEWYKDHISFWNYIGAERMAELKKIRDMALHDKFEELYLAGRYNPENGKIYGAMVYKYAPEANVSDEEKEMVSRVMESLQFSFQTWIRLVVSSTEEYYQTTFSDTFNVSKAFDYFRNLGSGFTKDGKIVWNLAFEPYQNGRV